MRSPFKWTVYLRFTKMTAFIPANVAQAANFYQTNGCVHGQPKIHAADPAHTHIIGNFRFDYALSEYDCAISLV